MSRCFPFPPPGYEKKARLDNVELFKEEKLREKKHKKKDKEKKESKEKGEKDRSDKKHREKKEKREKHKDKKEKHRDKKNDKDRDKDKEKSSISVEKRVSVGNNGEKLREKEEWHKDKSSVSDEKRPGLQFHGHSGKDPIQKSLRTSETDNFKFVLELDRRIREEPKGTGSQLFESSMGTDWKRGEGRDGYVDRNTGILDEGKPQNRDKKVEDRKMGPQRIGDEARSGGNSMVQSAVGIVQKKAGVPQPTEKNVERKMDGKEKEKSKDREGDDKRGDKRKDKDREKKNHGKDKDRDKEKKNEEKAKEKNEHKKVEQDKSKDMKKNNLIGVLNNNRSSHLPEDNHTSVVPKGNHKKRKDIERNGYLHDDEARPIKVPKLSSPFKVNGRKLDACPSPGLSTSNVQVATSNIKVDNERKENGFREAQPSSAPKTKPSSSVRSADPMAEASSKPPHPDSKYLSQILSVPKMEEWSDFNDQEWLFGSRGPPPKKPEPGSVGLSEELRVWAGAVQIESADICALPYVIPY